MATQRRSSDPRAARASRASRAVSVTAPTSGPVPFRWKNDMACVATFNVLEHDDKMDQFEDVDVPFDKAGGLQMGQLRYWPGVSLPADALDSLGRLKAQEFLKLLSKNFSSKKQDPSLTAAGVIRKVGKIFAKKTATLSDLAAEVDASFLFPDET